VIPSDGNVNVDVSAPVGLISQIAPTAQPASHGGSIVLKSEFWVGKRQVEARIRPRSHVGGTEKRCFGLQSLHFDADGTSAPEQVNVPGVSVAPVTLTSNESTVTPAGGVSVIVKDIGTPPSLAA